MSTEATEATVAPARWRIGLVGYGEVGRILAEDLRSRDHVVRAWDLKLGHDASAGAMREHAAAHGVFLAGSSAEAAAGAEPGDQRRHREPDRRGRAGGVPGPGAERLRPRLQFRLARRQAEAARLVEGAGGRYVEGAVMTSISPLRLLRAALLGGPSARDLAAPLNAIGFAARVASEKLGVASATKMCRSVIVKGREAMVIESFTAARHYGVEGALVASLQETFPGIDWERQAAYFFQRAIAHGRRRAEEMREAAQTVREAGLAPWSAAGTAERQAWMTTLADAGTFGSRGDAGFARSADWRAEADRILILNRDSSIEPE